MKLLNIFALVTLLALGSGASAFAHPPKVHRHLLHSHQSRSQQAALQQEFVVVTIRAIDHAQGLLTLETAIGFMQVQVAPEETRDLRVGDKLQVRVLSADRVEA